MLRRTQIAADVFLPVLKKHYDFFLPTELAIDILSPKVASAIQEVEGIGLRGAKLLSWQSGEKSGILHGNNTLRDLELDDGSQLTLI